MHFACALIYNYFIIELKAVKYMHEILIPSIFQCYHYVAKCSATNRRYVKDYEFDYYVGGHRDMYIDKQYHEISQGVLVFRKPGQLVESCGDYNVYTLTLDFSREFNIPQDQYVRNRKGPTQALCHNSIFNCVPETFFPYHQDDIGILFKKIADYCYPNTIDMKKQEELVSELILLILSDAKRYYRDSLISMNPKDNYVEKACKYINKHYHEETSVESIAAYLSLNKNYLIRLFKRELSITPNQYIIKTRLFYAKTMLIQTNLTVENISFACGFNSPSYFIKCFKNFFGNTPNSYRKDCH